MGLNLSTHFGNVTGKHGYTGGHGPGWRKDSQKGVIR